MTDDLLRRACRQRDAGKAGEQHRRLAAVIERACFGVALGRAAHTLKHPGPKAGGRIVWELARRGSVVVLLRLSMRALAESRRVFAGWGPGRFREEPVSVDAVSLHAGMRRGLRFAAAAFAIALAFGALARPVIGPVAPVVMSIVVFSGAAQFGALAVLGAGGSTGAAIAAGVLINARYLVMGLGLAPSLRGALGARIALALSMVDSSWAAASRGDGTFDACYMAGASIPQYAAWLLGTLAGVLIGGTLGTPQTYGLDALFPAFFVSLLFEEVHGPQKIAAAFGGAAIALALTPLLPPGMPILAAAGAAVGASKASA